MAIPRGPRAGARWRLVLPLLLAGLTCGFDAAAQDTPAITDLQGQAVTLHSFYGRVVLVNVWATWCGPCREEMPELDRLYGELDDAHATVIGIAADLGSAVAASPRWRCENTCVAC
jgi:thiol-disulfide isomerase/thioredoxin